MRRSLLRFVFPLVILGTAASAGVHAPASPQRRRVHLLTFALLLVAMVSLSVRSASARAAGETVVFDGGSPNGVQGLRVSDIGFIVSAADFEIAEDLPVTRAEIWTSEFSEQFQWGGAVNYYVLPDLGGSPTGPPLYNGAGSSVTKAPDSAANCCGNAKGFKYSFEFDPPLDLQPATRYWLAINLPGAGTVVTTQAFWASTGTGFGNSARITGDPTLSSWGTYGFDLAFRLLHVADVLDVAIDIKPGSGENTVNVGSKGVLPVVILSGTDFAATDIDPATVLLAGSPVRTAANGTRRLCTHEDVNGDGLVDLLCAIETSSLVVEHGDEEAELTAETFDGARIVGRDRLRIVP
jgi:hypothetical protein